MYQFDAVYQTATPPHLPVLGKMGRLGEVTLLINFLLLLGTLHGVRANFDDYSFEEEEYGFDASDDYGENEEPEYGYEEEDADDSVATTGTGNPPQSGPRLLNVKAYGYDKGCEIEVSWEASPGVCLAGYRVGFRQSLGGSSNWTWIDSTEGTFQDLRSGKNYILEKGQGGHFQIIQNLPYQTEYQVVIEAFNQFGSKMGNIMEATTPPG